MPGPLKQLQAILLRRSGGDSIMAQVLAAVPIHGLEPVLAAAQLALEAGKPSGEHVLNVLGRLNAVPAPESAATALQVSTPPLANTERYDSLRTGSAANATTKEADHA